MISNPVGEDKSEKCYFAQSSVEPEYRHNKIAHHMIKSICYDVKKTTGDDDVKMVLAYRHFNKASVHVARNIEQNSGSGEKTFETLPAELLGFDSRVYAAVEISSKTLNKALNNILESPSLVEQRSSEVAARGEEMTSPATATASSSRRSLSQLYAAGQGAER
jgi:hypothetical protein